jgi:hypothetical protein
VISQLNQAAKPKTALIFETSFPTIKAWIFSTNPVIDVFLILERPFTPKIQTFFVGQLGVDHCANAPPQVF